MACSTWLTWMVLRLSLAILLTCGKWQTLCRAIEDQESKESPELEEKLLSPEVSASWLPLEEPGIVGDVHAETLLSRRLSEVSMCAYSCSAEKAPSVSQAEVTKLLPMEDRGLLFAGTKKGAVVAWDAVLGTKLWAIDVSADQPIIFLGQSKDIVIAIALANATAPATRVSAFNATSQLWTQDYQKIGKPTAGSLTQDTLVIASHIGGSQDGVVSAYDVDNVTSSQKWELTHPGGNPEVLVQDAPSGLVFSWASDHSLTAIRTSAAIRLWEHTRDPFLDGKNYTGGFESTKETYAMCVANGILYTMSAERWSEKLLTGLRHNFFYSVKAYAAETGKIKWEYKSSEDPCPDNLHEFVKLNRTLVQVAFDSDSNQIFATVCSHVLSLSTSGEKLWEVGVENFQFWKPQLSISKYEPIGALVAAYSDGNRKCNQVPPAGAKPGTNPAGTSASGTNPGANPVVNPSAKPAINPIGTKNGEVENPSITYPGQVVAQNMAVAQEVPKPTLSCKSVDKVIALDLADGQLLWEMSGPVSMLSASSSSNFKAYVANTDGEVQMRNATACSTSDWKKTDAGAGYSGYQWVTDKCSASQKSIPLTHNLEQDLVSKGFKGSDALGAIMLLVVIAAVCCLVLRDKFEGSGEKDKGKPEEPKARSLSMYTAEPKDEEGSPLLTAKERNLRNKAARPYNPSREDENMLENPTTDEAVEAPAASQTVFSMPKFEQLLPRQQFLYQPLSVGVQPSRQQQPQMTVVQGTTGPISLPAGMFGLQP